MTEVMSSNAPLRHNGEQAKVKKPYVRIMTERRRAQNRQAQQAYRDRHKERLKALDDRINATKSNFSKVTASIVPADDAGGDGPASHVHNSAKTSPLTAPTSTTGTNSTDPVVIDFHQVFRANGDLPVPYGLQDIVPLVAHIPAQVSEDLHAAVPTTTPCPPDNEFVTDHDEPYSWPMPFRPASDPYHPPPPEAPAFPVQSYTPYLSGALSTTTRKHAYQYQRKALASTKTPRPDSFTFLPSPLDSILPPSSTPQNAIAASLAIAAVMKISRQAYLTDAPSKLPLCFLALIHTPPQPDPHILASDGNAYVPTMHTTYSPAPTRIPAVAAGAETAALEIVKRDPDVKRRWADHALRVPKNLRPKAVQYMRAHPSYLDCIVWGGMRERCVAASVAGTLDHVEFFLDLMHGGVICWGGVEVKGRGWREEVPWSAKSWEAKGWFLRKWAWLIGTEEEEMRNRWGGDEEEEEDDVGVWSGSRRWWRMREGDFDQEDAQDAGNGEGGRDMFDYDAAARQWAEGQVQENWEGAWAYPWETMASEYVPMSGNHSV